MPFKKTLLAMMMFGAAAAQADYQFELSAALGEASYEYEIENPFGADYDVDQDVSELDLGATFYFAPVNTAKGPLAEAAFLSKSSEVAIDISRDEVEWDDDDEYDIDSNIISGQFVLPNPSLIFRAAWGQGEDDGDDTDLLGIGFGGYITDHITLTLDYIQVDYDFDEDDESVDSFILTYKQLIEFGGDSSLVIEPYLASIDDFGDDAAKVGIDVTWYITRQLGLTAGISGYGVEDDGGDFSRGDSRVGVDYFINENFHIGGALTSMSSEYDGDDGYDEEGEGGGIEFNAAVRF
jgi:hypothetical protein